MSFSSSETAIKEVSILAVKGYKVGAAILHVPIELLDFKFRIMKWKGYKLAEPPINARNNFLKDMDVPYDSYFE